MEAEERIQVVWRLELTAKAKLSGFNFPLNDPFSDKNDTIKKKMFSNFLYSVYIYKVQTRSQKLRGCHKHSSPVSVSCKVEQQT